MNAHDTSIDLAAYFERIGYAESVRPAPTFDTLRAQHLLQPHAIPFENLDVLIGRPIRLDLESIQRKLVAGRRGVDDTSVTIPRTILEKTFGDYLCERFVCWRR